MMQRVNRLLLATNLRQLRQARGWSQEQLAAQCGLHRTYIGAVERGERNIGLDNLERLANALQTSVCALLDIVTDNKVCEQRSIYNANLTLNCHVYLAFCYS